MSSSNPVLQGSPEIFDSGIVCNSNINGQHFLQGGVEPHQFNVNTDTNVGCNPLSTPNNAVNSVIYQNMYQQMLANSLCSQMPNFLPPGQFDGNANNMMDAAAAGLCSLPMSCIPGGNPLFQPNPLFGGSYSPQNIMNVPQHMSNCGCNVCLVNRNASMAYMSYYQNQLMALNTWNTMQIETNSNYSTPVSRQPPSSATKSSNIFSSSPKYQHENNKINNAAFSLQQDCDALAENMDLMCNVTGGVGNGVLNPLIDTKATPLNHQNKKKPTGVSKNILYKTMQCNDFKTMGTCPRGNNCQFAHGNDEVHDPRNHSLYKTAFCNDFKEANFCPRGNNCFHVHDPSEMRQKNNNRLSFGKKHGGSSRFCMNMNKVVNDKEPVVNNGRLSPSSVAQIINMHSNIKVLANDAVKKETEEIWNILNLSHSTKNSPSLK